MTEDTNDIWPDMLTPVSEEELPQLYKSALEHVERTAMQSRSQARRIRWIQRRCRIALDGFRLKDKPIELPKKSPSGTPEKLQRHNGWLKYANKQLTEVLESLLANSETTDYQRMLIEHALDQYKNKLVEGPPESQVSVVVP